MGRPVKSKKTRRRKSKRASSHKSGQSNSQQETQNENLVFQAGRFHRGTGTNNSSKKDFLGRAVAPATLAIGKKEIFLSPRFRSIPAFREIIQGKTILKRGARGLPVIFLQRMLVGMGIPLPKFGVDGKFEGETKRALKRFQKIFPLSKGFSPGVLDRVTLLGLDHAAATYLTERKLAGAFDPSKPLKGARALSKKEQKLIKKHIQLVRNAGGKFDPKKKKAFLAELKPALESVIKRKYKSARIRLKAYQQKRQVPNNRLQTIMSVGQKAVDRVFGAYVGRKFGSGKKLSYFNFKTGTLKETYSYMIREFRRISSGNRYLWVMDQLGYYCDTDKKLRGILSKYNAGRHQPLVARMLNQLFAGFLPAYGKKILRTIALTYGMYYRNKLIMMPAGPKEPGKERSFMWNLYHLSLHEYIHSLEHPNYKKWRDAPSQAKMRHILLEGVTEYLTRIVLYSTPHNAPLFRQAIEGKYYQPGKNGPVPDHQPYKKAAQLAEQLAGIVGPRNLFLAYFKGKVEYIGGSK